MSIYTFPGQAIQYLTSLPEHSELSKLPVSLLKEKLKDLITEASKMASVTRRGAGLSVMVHRIVSHDSKRGKVCFKVHLHDRHLLTIPFFLMQHSPTMLYW